MTSGTMVRVCSLVAGRRSPHGVITFVGRFIAVGQVTSGLVPSGCVTLFVFKETSVMGSPVGRVLSPSCLRSARFVCGRSSSVPGCVSSLCCRLPMGRTVSIMCAERFGRRLRSGDPGTLVRVRRGEVTKFCSVLSETVTRMTGIKGTMLTLSSVLNRSGSVTSGGV